MSDRRGRVADVIVDLLAEAGVRAVFGLPGGSISPIFDALLDRRDIQLITVKHESAAVFAAAGYAFATGNLGVALVTSGPGILNGLVGLAAAQCDGLPVIVIAGEAAHDTHGRGALQEGSAYGLNIVQMAKHICKAAVEIPEASAAPTLVKRAIGTALSGKRGPALISLPINIGRAEISVPHISQHMSAHFEFDDLSIDAAAKALSRSKHKVIFAGSGVRHGRGPALLRELAEMLQCPVMTTPKGKGVFPEAHPLSLGIFGLGGHPGAREHLETGMETVLAIGTSLGDLATNGWSKLLEPSRTFIHVDIDAGQIGRAYNTNLNIAASAEAFLERVIPRCTPSAQPACHGIRYNGPTETSRASLAGRITPPRALWELQEVMAEDTIYTVDSGEHTVFALHYLKSLAPDTFMSMLGLGPMSASIGAAIGAQVAHPDRRAVVICGDGGFAMGCAEVTTAVQARLPVTFAVFNDQRLGMVELGHEAVYGRAPSYPTGPINISGLARSLGANAYLIDRPGAILDCKDLIGPRDYPIVLDIRIDETMRMPKHARLADPFGGLKLKK